MPSETLIYKEVFTPWFAPLVFFLPCFYRYGITISIVQKQRSQQKNTGEDSNSDYSSTFMTFGYGMTSPGGLTSHTVSLSNIDKDSMIVGTATARDNLLTFGGWGIRGGYSNGRFTWAYNARNGPYLEFDEKGIDNEGKITRYRIVSKDVEKVASILRGESTEIDDVEGSNVSSDVKEKEGQESNPLLVTGLKA